MSEKNDVLVVGAGTAGLSAAHHLVARGLRVTVLEARHPYGPTLFKEIGLGLVGLLDPESRLERGLGPGSAREVVAFSLDGVRGVAAAAERFGSPSLAGRVDRRPMNPTEADDIARSVPILRECGATVTANADGSIRVEEDLLVDVRAFHVGLGRGLVSVLATTPVTRLRVEADGVTAETPSGVHHAEMAVIATGPRTAEIRPDLAKVVFPLRAQGARFPGVFPAGRAFGVVSQFGHENYVVEQNGDLVAFGFNPSGRKEDTGFSEEPTREFQGYLLRFARERFPEIERGAIEPRHTWAAPLAFTRDGLPLVGPVPGEPRLIVAAGFCGRGLPLGFEAGRRIAALVAGEATSIPGAFSLRRDAASE